MHQKPPRKSGLDPIYVPSGMLSLSSGTDETKTRRRLDYELT